MAGFSGWGEKTRTVFTEGGRKIAGRLEKMPSLHALLKYLSLLRWPAFFIAGVLVAGVVVDALVVYVLTEKKKPKRTAPVAVTAGLKKSYLASRPTYKSVSHKNIFCPGCEIPDLESRKVEKTRDCKDAQKASGATLVGTIVLSNPIYSVATLSAGAGPSKTVKVGDVLNRVGTVYEIQAERVCFVNDSDDLVYVELPDAGKVAIRPQVSARPTRGRPPKTAAPKVDGINNVGENEFEIEKDFLRKSLQDPNILTQAHATPYLVDGEIQGFRINSISRGSVFEALGIQPNDVISEVDGEPMNSLARAQEIYSKFLGSDAEGLSMTVKRGGQDVTLDYKVK